MQKISQDAKYVKMDLVNFQENVNNACRIIVKNAKIQALKKVVLNAKINFSCIKVNVIHALQIAKFVLMELLVLKYGILLFHLKKI